MSTLDLQVSANEDDVRHDFDDPTHTLYTGVTPGGGNFNGIELSSAYRFLAAGILPGSSVQVAYMEVVSLGSVGTDVRTLIRGHYAGNSFPVTDDADWHSIVDSGLTAAQPPWDITSAWTNGISYQSVDVAAVIEAIVGHPNWVFNSDLHLFVLDNGSPINNYRVWRHHNNTPADAVRLHIEFTDPVSEFKDQATFVLGVNQKHFTTQGISRSKSLTLSVVKADQHILSVTNKSTHILEV